MNGIMDEQGLGERLLGEGDLPAQLSGPNFGAFLLAVLWAPVHGLWGWFAVFVALEGLESFLGLTHARFLGVGFPPLVAMTVFRIVYWTATLVFALRADRLVWSRRRRQATRVSEPGRAPKPITVATYVAHRRIWTAVGLIGVAIGLVSLAFFRVDSATAADILVTTGTQAVLLVALFVYDRTRRASPAPTT